MGATYPHNPILWYRFKKGYILCPALWVKGDLVYKYFTFKGLWGREWGSVNLEV